MSISLSKKRQGVLAIAGHAGCGHCHSHNQYIQDDSGGLAAVLTLFQEATGLSLVIKDIRVHTGMDGYIVVETEGGGCGKATARRGITLQEARLAKSLIGREAIRTQTLVLEAFGRFYGQGVHETPVALQTAMANAALDTFVRAFPENFKSCFEDISGSCGLIAGAVLDFDGIPVAVLGTVNASVGGVGPNEDMEGNAAVGQKQAILQELGMLEIPTIVVEGKVYSPIYSRDLNKATFLVRADREEDNPWVGGSIMNAACTLGFPAQLREDVTARSAGGMASQTRQLGEKIASLGIKLQHADYAQDKIAILAELASLVSEDGAGISFMSNRLHEIIGGVGMNPGSGAVFNYIVPLTYRNEFLFPFITEEDLARFVALAKQSVVELHKVLAEATAHVRTRRYAEDLDAFVLKGDK